MKNIEKQDIINELTILRKKYEDIRFGLAGSYANGTFDADSDVDIILDASDNVMGNLKINVDIYNKLVERLNKEIDLVWLKLLKEDSDDSDKLAIELEIGINEHTPYRNIMREVIWVE